MASHTTLGALFTAIATEIRAKTGGTEEIIADDFPTAIGEIETGADVSGVTASESDVRAGKVFVKADGTQASGAVTERTEADVVTQELDSGSVQVTVKSGIYNSDLTKEVEIKTRVFTGNKTIGSSYVTTLEIDAAAGAELIGVFIGSNDADDKYNALATMTFVPNVCNVLAAMASSTSTNRIAFNAAGVTYDKNTGKVTINTNSSSYRFVANATYEYAVVLQ